MIFISLIITVIAGLRNAGPDYDGYKYCFDNVPIFKDYILNIRHDYCGSSYLEFTYYLYISIVKSLNSNFSFFIFCTSLLHFLLLIKLSKSFKYESKFIFGYIFTVGFYFQFWYVKQGIATLILLLCFLNIYNKDSLKLKDFFLFLLSTTIHLSSLFIGLIIFFIGKCNKKILLTLTIFFIALNFIDRDILTYYLNINYIISQTKYSDYLNSTFSKSSIGLMSILCMFIYTLSVISDKTNNVGINLIVLALWSILIMGNIPLSGRISSYYMPIGIIIYFQYLFIRFKNSFTINIIYTLFILIYFVKTFILDDYNRYQIDAVIQSIL